MRKRLFEERFEDAHWTARGWYDNPRFETEQVDGRRACVWRWKKAGDINPAGGGARAHLPPVENVVLSFAIKHSPDWAWTGVNWHPHEFHFVTTEDPEFVGPAYTHLTFYIEVVNGTPRIAIQDGKNIDAARVGQDLTKVTEKRAVAGGNGDSDGHGNLGHYKNGDAYWNGKHWEPGGKFFRDERGPFYKADWHRVEASLQLNSVQSGIGQRDGILRYRFDGKTVLEHRNVVFRTGQFPRMKINQFLMTPYFGPGVPHPQSIWIDDLRIDTEPGGLR